MFSINICVPFQDKRLSPKGLGLLSWWGTCGAGDLILLRGDTNPLSNSPHKDLGSLASEQKWIRKGDVSKNMPVAYFCRIARKLPKE